MNMVQNNKYREDIFSLFVKQKKFSLPNYYIMSPANGIVFLSVIEKKLFWRLHRKTTIS